MRKECNDLKIVFLNCNSWKYPNQNQDQEDIEFFGCTLWSEMKFSSWIHMNDSKIFKQHQDYIDEHYHHKTWLEQALTKSSDCP